MKKVIKFFYKKTKIGYWIISFFIKIYLVFLYHVVPEKIYLKRRFRKTFKREIDLNNPETLNEKIVWLKINDRTPLHTTCADKYAVREYIKEKVGEEYLVPLHYQTKNVKDIIPENLPDTPSIIKTNHDSSGGIFVYNKSEINWEEARKTLKKRLKKNYYPRTKEWQYKNIDRCIIVEKLLIDKNGKIPFDYKVHCFNGKVNMIQVDVDRNTDHHCRNYYSTKWIREPYKWTFIKPNNKEVGECKEDVKKPETLKQMIVLSEKLASEFCYVRVDWYDLDGALYFGELTFHQDGGNRPITPEKWDKVLGDKLILPKK